MHDERQEKGLLARVRCSVRCVLVWCVLAGLSACQTKPTPIGPEGLEALPTYAEVYAQAEARVGALDRFWAVASVGLRYTDAEGDRRRDQVEGHLQFIRPSKVALTLGKLGDTLLLLGCDDDRFWWIERIEEKRAFVGDQRDARRLALERVGVPVLPTDMLLLGDLVPWPAPGTEYEGRVVETVRPEMNAAEVFAVEFRASGRTRRVYLTRSVFDPVGVDLYTDDGRLVAQSELTLHERVLNRLDPLRHQRVPARINIDVPSAESRIEMNLSRMEISDRRPKALVFDLNELIERFGIEEVIRLEDSRPAGRGVVR